MNTVFIGGSRHISRLPVEVRQRLDNVIHSGHRIIVGDANGADKAVQRHLSDAAYDKVTVFCSGHGLRNNLGHWATHNVTVPSNLKGFQFYAAKDREMARKADFGLMIWDGKSPGTILNVLRMVRAGKIVVLFNMPNKRAINIKAEADWDSFLASCSEELRRDVRDRATPEEWEPNTQASLRETSDKAEDGSLAGLSDRELAASLNAAFAAADPVAVVNALGKIARTRGMSRVARETGLARESLYRALGDDGNPEFATVLRVLSSLGLRLAAQPAREAEHATA